MNDLELSKLSELVEAKDRVLEHLDELNARLDTFRSLDRPDVIAIIQTLMAMHGMFLREAITWRPANRSLQGSTVPRKRSAPKYRHPVSGLPWAGRGLKPRWLQAELAAGREPSSRKATRASLASRRLSFDRVHGVHGPAPRLEEPHVHPVPKRSTRVELRIARHLEHCKHGKANDRVVRELQSELSTRTSPSSRGALVESAHGCRTP